MFFFVATSSENLVKLIIKSVGIHPLTIVLGITLITFIFGVIGLKDVKGWSTMSKSIVTIFLTMGLAGVLIFILSVVSLFS